MVIYKLGVVDIMAVTTSIFQKHAQEIIVEKLSVSEKSIPDPNQLQRRSLPVSHVGTGKRFVLGLVWVWGRK